MPGGKHPCCSGAGNFGKLKQTSSGLSCRGETIGGGCKEDDFLAHFVEFLPLFGWGLALIIVACSKPRVVGVGDGLGEVLDAAGELRCVRRKLGG